MDEKFWSRTAVLALLLLGILICGCSGEPAAPSAAPATLSTAPQAKYVAGDIVARPAQSSSDAYALILRYDRATDQYERAWIYRNPDGNFGYRADNRSESSPRTLVEKLYSVKLSHIHLSSIPIITPSTTTGVSSSAGSAPTFYSVSPASASKGSIVTVTVTGSNFRDGVTVKLIQGGLSPVKADAVSVVSPVRIDCTFSLAGLQTGTANVIITNPDGQYVSAANAFTIVKGGPVITSVYPGTVNTGETRRITIYGQNFQEFSKIWIAQGQSELACINPIFEDTVKVSCDLAIPVSAKRGSWNVSVLNIADQQTGTYARPFMITNTT